ncbi:MAG: CHASE2 domain-containing protein [Gammaproteobacteria bacterium]
MKRWLIRSTNVFGVALVGVFLELTPLGTHLEQNVGLSWLFHLRGPVEPPPQAVVVAINDQTGGHLGLSKLPREWPRSVHGRLVDRLSHLGASAIIFDFDFQTPKQTEDDDAFAKSIAASGRVVLTQKLIGKRQPLFAPDGQVKSYLWVEQLISPIPVLTDAAKGLGIFPLPKLDVAVHEFWTFKNTAAYTPAIPAVALQLVSQNSYPALVKLLEEAGVSKSPVLPRRINHSDRAPKIQSLMLELRRLFQQSPQLGIKLRGMIDKQASTPNPALLKALLALYAGSDHRYLNFYGPPGTITTLPYHSVLEKETASTEIEFADLTGKVVFVGYSDIYDPAQPDRFYTVFTNDEGVDLSGVEIAATAFANLLTDRSLLPPDPGTLALMVTTFGIVIGVTLMLPAVVSVPLTLFIGALYLYVCELVFSKSNLWLPLAVPLLVQLPLALFSGLVIQYLSERRKQKRATRAIGYYLPEKLAREITEKNLESSAINKVTYSICLASDMAGFTTISEQLRPKELAVFLNDYFDTLSICLKKHRVDVIEFRADGIMCAWTSEKPDAAMRRRAIMAALEAVDAIHQFSLRNPLLSQPLRIGLEAGMVYVGHSGGGGHFVYSIVGDCANTAARIEGLNKRMGTRILTSQTVVEDLDGLLLRYLGDFQFVGKTDALPIVEIMATEETATLSQSDLCRRYRDAMTLFSMGRYPEALAMFEAISSAYPFDGPSRFHMNHCQELMNKPAIPEVPTRIRLDSK